MYKFRYVFVLMTSFVLGACGSDTPESFGETAFSHLKAENAEELISLAATEEDYFELIAERNKTSEKQVNKTPADIERMAEKNQKKVTKRVNDIIAYGKMNGGWENASLIEVQVKQSDKKPSEADVYLNVEIDDKHYRIIFDDIALAERGWVMTDNPRWIGLIYDPQFDQLIGQTSSISPGQPFLSCNTSNDIEYVELMADTQPELVVERVKMGHCLLTQLESELNFTVKELGDYSRDRVKKSEKYPFEHIKVDFVLEGQNYSQWIPSDWLTQ